MYWIISTWNVGRQIVQKITLVIYHIGLIW